MNQRKHNRTLYWEDEAQPANPAIQGEYFWRSVYKGIESRESHPAVSRGAREVRLEPPRDYVVEIERGLRG